MHSRFASALIPATSQERDATTPWLQRVQSSLYRRLQRTYGPRAGTVAWMLIRLAQPTHRDHRSTAETVLARHLDHPRELEALVAAARGARAAPTIAPIPDAIALVSRILSSLEALATSPEGWAPDPLTISERAELLAIEDWESPRAKEILGLVGEGGWRVS